MCAATLQRCPLASLQARPPTSVSSGCVSDQEWDWTRKWLRKGEVFDAKGRKNYAWRTVYRVGTDAAVEGWSSIQAAWEPWHQERPVFRARVITPDHVEHWLDPKTIAEVAAQEDGRNLFSDRR